MKIKALTTFSGVLTMRRGEITEYGDASVISELIRAGYIEEIVDEPPKKGAKSNEGKRDNDGEFGGISSPGI